MGHFHPGLAIVGAVAGDQAGVDEALHQGLLGVGKPVQPGPPPHSAAFFVHLGQGIEDAPEAPGVDPAAGIPHGLFPLNFNGPGDALEIAVGGAAEGAIAAQFVQPLQGEAQQGETTALLAEVTQDILRKARFQIDAGGFGGPLDHLADRPPAGGRQGKTAVPQPARQALEARAMFVIIGAKGQHRPQPL